MTITNFSDVIADALQSPVFGMSRSVADLLAVEITREAAKRGHAGTAYHLHTWETLTRDERNACIRVEYDGTNTGQIARKYHVNRTTVWRIVRRFEMAAED